MAKENKSVFWGFMLLTYLSGTAAATFVPVMSLFLTDDVRANPTQLGIYFTVLAVVGILVTQTIAKFSDKNMSRRDIVCVASLFGMSAALLFVYIPNYYVILTLGVLCLSFSCVATPQIFALGREYAISRYGNSVMFTTYMRSCFAFAWVIAPPIAYLAANRFGFDKLFMATATIFLLQAVMGRMLLPESKKLLEVKAKEKLNVGEDENAIVLDDRIIGIRT